MIQTNKTLVMWLSILLLSVFGARAQPYLSPPGGTYYSLALSNHPPLPFNPFPSNAVVEVAPNVFFYDDSGVDYQAYFAPQGATQAPTETNLILAAKSGSAMLALGGGAGDTIVGTVDHIDNLRRINGTNTFRLSGLTVGQQYLLLAKPDITPFIDNPWRALGNFTASATTLTAQVYSPSNLLSEFYMLWRGPYNGPSVVINSPAPGSVVSGDIPIKLRVTDIAPVSLFVFLNGQPLTTVSSLLKIDLKTGLAAKFSGTPDFVIPAGAVRNGPNKLTIVAANSGVKIATNPTNTLSFGDSKSFSTTFDFTIIASNEFAIVVNPDMTAANAGTSEAKIEVTRPGDVTLDILDLDGALVQSISTTVTNPNGAMVTMRWNLKWAGGATYNNPAYVSRYNFTPSGEGAGLAAAAAKPYLPRFVTNKIDRNPMISGSPLITWMDLPESPNVNTLCDVVFPDLYTLFKDVLRLFYYTPPEVGVNRFNPVQLKFFEQTMADNVSLFHRNITNANFDTWIYHGHGNEEGLGFSTVGGAAPGIGMSVKAEEIGHELGNIYGTGRYGGIVDYKRRYRMVAMHACWTANINGSTNGGSPGVQTHWPAALGTPIGVDQTINRIYKSAFIGFESTVDAQPVFIEALMDDWPHPNLQDPNVPIVESMAFALDFAYDGDTTRIQSFGPKCLGFPWLPYTTIWDKQLSTNNFDSIHFFPF